MKPTRRHRHAVQSRLFPEPRRHEQTRASCASVSCRAGRRGTFGRPRGFSDRRACRSAKAAGCRCSAAGSFHIGVRDHSSQIGAADRTAVQQVRASERQADVVHHHERVGALGEIVLRHFLARRTAASADRPCCRCAAAARRGASARRAAHAARRRRARRPDRARATPSRTPMPDASSSWPGILRSIAGEIEARIAAAASVRRRERRRTAAADRRGPDTAHRRRSRAPTTGGCRDTGEDFTVRRAPYRTLT